MKVLYLTNTPAPYKVAFFNELSKKCDLTVLYDGIDKDKREDAWFKDNVTKYRYDNLGSFDFNKLKDYLNKGFDVIVNGKYASKYGAYLCMHINKNYRTYFITADGGVIKNNFIANKIKSFFISKGKYFLSSGEQTSKYFEYYGANKNNIYTYNFTSLFKKDILDKPVDYQEKIKLRKEKNLEYNRIFISVGSLINRKGYDLLLQSLKDNKLNDTLFLIVGSGEKKEELECYIKTNNINNVKFIGFKEKKEVFVYLKLSDVFIFPSREDIWGLVINEAMACGLPIISSDNVVAAKELVDKKYLYNPEDIAKLKELINTFNAYTEGQLYKIGLENINKIKDYTIENMAKRHLEIFNEVLNYEK